MLNCICATLGLSRMGEDVEEHPRRLGIPPHARGDQAQIPGDFRKAVRVQVEVTCVGQPEQAQQVDRVLLEDRRAVDGNPPAVEDEAVPERGGLGVPAGQDSQQPARARLEVVGLKLGREGAGEHAHVLGDQEIAPHETFDRGGVVAVLAGTVVVAHPPGDLGLKVEGQALFRPAGGEVQVRADRFEEVEGADEGAHLPTVEHLHLQHGLETVGRMQILGDPEQGVQIAQAALALLHIGFDHEAADACPGVPLVAFLELGRDEFGASAFDHLFAEPLLQGLGKFRVTGQPARLQYGGPDRHVLAA
jgi:hypothetical protein